MIVSFIPIQNYIPLKPNINDVNAFAEFYTYTELHTSQTSPRRTERGILFYTYTELHTSQTSNEVVYKFYPYGIGFRIDTNTIFLGN